jgi:hypothetical protein
MSQHPDLTDHPSVCFRWKRRIDFTDVGVIVVSSAATAFFPRFQSPRKTISGGNRLASVTSLRQVWLTTGRGPNAMSAKRGMDGQTPYSKIIALFAAGGKQYPHAR